MPSANKQSVPSSFGLLSIFHKRKMPSLFNTVRLCIYLTVIAFTIICLAMAANFQHVLASSDLTHFVPFSIFVCSMSVFIMVTLLGFSFIKGNRNPISTRLELACLCFAGCLWLILGIVLATSDSQDADVECFASELDTVPLDDSDASFHTDAYQAMYRVLMVFSFFNTIILLISFAALLYLALKRYYNGDEQMWYGPVTSCPWLSSYSKSDSLLPGPRGGKAADPTMQEKSSRQKSRNHRRGMSGSSRRAAHYPTPIADAHISERQPDGPSRDLYRRDASPRRRT